MYFEDGDQGPVGFPGSAVAERGAEAARYQKIGEGDILIDDCGFDFADVPVELLFGGEVGCYRCEETDDDQETG